MAKHLSKPTREINTSICCCESDMHYLLGTKLEECVCCLEVILSLYDKDFVVMKRCDACYGFVKCLEECFPIFPKQSDPTVVSCWTECDICVLKTNNNNLFDKWVDVQKSLCYECEQLIRKYVGKKMSLSGKKPF